MELVKRFSRVFRDSGLGQAEFGARIGQKQNAVSQVLSGSREPSKPMLRAIITNFDVSPAWLFDGSGDPYKVAQAVAEPSPAYVTRVDFEDVPGRLKRLEEDSRAVLPLIRLVEDLNERVKQLEKRLGRTE